MLLTFIITLFLSAILQIFMPWWSIALAALVAGFLSQTTPWRTFLSGAVAIGVLWLGFILAISLLGSTAILPKLTELAGLPHPFFLYVLTVGIGALTAGMAALSGIWIKEAFFHDKDD